MSHNAVLLVTDRTKFDAQLRVVSHADVVLYVHHALGRYSQYVQCFGLTETWIQGIYAILYNVLIGMFGGVVQPGLDALAYSVLLDRMWHPQLHI